jgi:hypothetical protein
MFQPLGNTTVLAPTGWHPEPRLRGTFSILSSCLITMSLCIWTSVHLNVPEHRKEHLQKYRRLGWMVLGLLAPEIVVWNAWEQRKEAKRLSALMKEKGFMPETPSIWKRMREWFAKVRQRAKVFLLLKAEDWPEPAPINHHNGHIHAWTDVHSWLVVMGGVAFEDTSPDHQQFIPEDCQRLPINLYNFEWMVTYRPHLIPDIPRSYIEDKSKSDWLAKGITCWQAGQFCIQCIFRLSQQLSITLLELNVFAHAICALLLFVVWWDKPRDVNEPTIILGEEALDICACFCHVDVINQKGALPLAQAHDSRPLEECFEVGRPMTFTVRSRWLAHLTSCVAVIGSHEYDTLNVRGTFWRMSRPSRSGDEKQCPEHDVTLTSRDINRLERVYRAVEQSSTTPELLKSVRVYIRRMAYDRISNWNMFNAIRRFHWSHYNFEGVMDDANLWLPAKVTLAGACYGGLHLIAWASAFPSPTEAVMWRAASVTILATGPLCSLFSHLFPWMGDLVIEGKGFEPFIGIFGGYLSLSLSLWYVLCRTFIVVECFILLAHIPETALHVPTWAAYIPSFN